MRARAAGRAADAHHRPAHAVVSIVPRKNAVRSALRYVMHNPSGAMVLNSLRSKLAYVEPVIDPTRRPSPAVRRGAAAGATA